MNKSAKILVVDDEETICYVLKINLELAGYSIVTANSAEEALRLDLSQFNLLLLDVMMERMSGFELAKRIRQDARLKHIPIIFCTAKDSEDDVLTGFDTGADDYIKKPFSMKELLARVKSVLSRSTMSGHDASVIEFGGLTLDTVQKSCTVNGRPVMLTPREFETLTLLLSNIDRIFSRDEILSAVWHDKHDVIVVDRTIDVNINRLRKKIGEYGNHIITKTGFGYGFSTKI